MGIYRGDRHGRFRRCHVERARRERAAHEAAPDTDAVAITVGHQLTLPGTCSSPSTAMSSR